MLVSSDFRTRPEEKSSDGPHSRVSREINSLTERELLQLRKFAQWRIHKLGHLAAGREHTDLLHEAIAAALDGRRRWIPDDVPIFAYLKGAMQSISYAWYRKALTEARSLPPDDDETDEDDYRAGLELHNIPAQGSDPEQQAALTETVQAIVACLRDDDKALKIISAMIEGQTSSEIMASMGITDREYYSARKRILRRLQNLFDPQNRRAQETKPSEEP